MQHNANRVLEPSERIAYRALARKMVIIKSDHKLGPIFFLRTGSVKAFCFKAPMRRINTVLKGCLPPCEGPCISRKHIEI